MRFMGSPLSNWPEWEWADCGRDDIIDPPRLECTGRNKGGQVRARKDRWNFGIWN